MKKIKEIKTNSNCNIWLIGLLIIIVCTTIVYSTLCPSTKKEQTESTTSDYINLCNAEYKVISITKYGDRLWYKIKTSTGGEQEWSYITDDFTKDCTMFEINRLRDRVSRLEDNK